MNSFNINYNYQINHQQTHQNIPVYTKLSQVYADIEGQLCSKQSTLFNKLKNNFMKLYSNLTPSHYVIINHVLSLSHLSYTLSRQDVKIAIQNGIIILLKQTYLNDKIFINGINDKQLIYDSNGKFIVEESSYIISQMGQQLQQNKLNKDISKIIELGTEQLSLNKLYGCTILVHRSISQEVKYYRQKLLLGIYISVLIINQQFNKMSMNEIMYKLYESTMFDDEFLEQQFMQFNKGEAIIKRDLQNNGNENDNREQDNKEISIESVKLSNKQKLLLFDMNLTKQQIAQLNNSYSQIYSHIVQKLINKQENKQLNEKNSQQTQLSNQIQIINKKINQFQNQQMYLSDLVVGFNQLKHNIHNKLVSNPKLHNPKQDNSKLPNSKLINTTDKLQLTTRIKQIASYINKSSQQSIIIDTYLLIVVKSHQVHQHIRLLKKYINTQTQSQIQNPQLITSRFSNFNKSNAQSNVFSSAPSLSIAVLNPQHQIWFK